MKRLNIWLALTLIALALFLSAARNEVHPSEKETSNQTKVESENAGRAPILTHDDQNHHDAEAKAATNNTYNYNDDFNYVVPPDAHPYWSLAANVGTAISAALALAIVLVAIWGGKIAKRTLDAIERQADAAEYATTTLERPWLSLDDIAPKEVGFDPSGYLVFEIWFNVVNNGRSPANIVSQMAGTRLSTDTASLSQEPEYPSQETSISAATLAASSKHHSSVARRIRSPELEQFFDEKLTFIFFGQILYRAVYDKETDPLHEYRWCLFYKRPFQYRVPRSRKAGYFYFAGPPAWNKST